MATALCLVAATAIASTTTEFLHSESALMWDIVAPLVGGALFGAQFGFLLSRRIDERLLKGIFCFVLLGIGLRMLLAMSVQAEPGEFHSGYSFLRASGVALIGVMAGTLSPLLGIGGGLIVVPGLLLSMPAIGGNGARAASLAVACVTSLRSIHLYAKERSIDPRIALWFALGGLMGAALGVQFAHLPGVSAYGQRTLGVILVVTALRFARDAFGPRVPVAEPSN
ncbi:Sulfite exporter TauE/SafE [Planctomycetes bacterium Poly30]|uniref:Probable membrane transporter protein n=1 Tax=Saltatorellus ferox TaxID=2528018 RepID=A0A518ER80_9BACT|nr:Sulfite exporter TauE/SafE [Planctomycetes bacterium Poly30]